MKNRCLIVCRGLLVAAAAAPMGCGGDDEDATALPANAGDAVETYAEIVHASYADSLTTARALTDAADALVAAPSADALTAAQDSWLEAREPYLQTEVYRFYGGPIDAEGGPEGYINAWPLDESYIDYVVGDPDAGIVNDPSQQITPALLVAENEGVNERTISTGYHAIEFLLWGQDMNEDGPGERPFTDYSLTNGTAANQDRRGLYLTTASELLVDHLEGLVEAWEPGEDNYRADFEAAPPADSLSKILSGMIILSGFETGQERLVAALDAHDQEEEHSCFSDNTHRDMVQDVRGVQNVWLGSYEPLDGPAISGTSVYSLIAAGDRVLADSISDQIAESLQLAEALQPPFDREIAADNPEGNARVEALYLALFEQRELLEEAFELYGLNRIPDPE